MPELALCRGEDLDALRRLRTAGWHIGIVTNGMTDNQQGKIRNTGDLTDPLATVRVMRASAERLRDWHAGGRTDPRPPASVDATPDRAPAWVRRVWAGPAYLLIYDPDGRPWRDRLTGRW